MLEKEKKILTPYVPHGASNALYRWKKNNLSLSMTVQVTSFLKHAYMNKHEISSLPFPMILFNWDLNEGKLSTSIFFWEDLEINHE